MWFKRTGLEPRNLRIPVATRPVESWRGCWHANRCPRNSERNGVRTKVLDDGLGTDGDPIPAQLKCRKLKRRKPCICIAKNLTRADGASRHGVGIRSVMSNRSREPPLFRPAGELRRDHRFASGRVPRLVRFRHGRARRGLHRRPICPVVL